MDHAVKLVNLTEVETYLANELYEKHIFQWFVHKLDCFDETANVHTLCTTKGITFVLIILVFWLY